MYPVWSGAMPRARLSVLMCGLRAHSMKGGLMARREGEAAKARDRKAYELHGQYAYLNFPEIAAEM